jgi:DnaJ-domain-containing protein 1
MRREALKWGRVIGRAAWDWAQEQPVVQRQRARVEARLIELKAQAQVRLARLEDELWEWIKQLEEERSFEAPHRAGLSFYECYTLLGVISLVSDSEVRKAWRALMLKCHPDRFAHDPEAEAEAAHEARRVNEAYQVVCRARGL